MSLGGRLEEVEVAEILHFLALNSRSGKITLSRRDGHGVVVLRLGRIVYPEARLSEQVGGRHRRNGTSSC